MVAVGELDPAAVAGLAMVGELGLDGSIRRVLGVVPLVEAIEADGVVVPSDCGYEALLVGRHCVRVASKLADLLQCLRGEAPWLTIPNPPRRPPPGARLDLSDVRASM